MQTALNVFSATSVTILQPLLQWYKWKVEWLSLYQKSSRIIEKKNLIRFFQVKERCNENRGKKNTYTHTHLQWTLNNMNLNSLLCACLVTRLCPTLCDPMNCSPPGSSVHGIFQQGAWSGLPFPPPGDRPYPGMEPRSLASPALTGRFSTTSTTQGAGPLILKIFFSNKYIVQYYTIHIYMACVLFLIKNENYFIGLDMCVI